MSVATKIASAPEQVTGMSNSTPPVYEIYLDETSQTKHRYLALGALILPLTLSEKIESSLRSARLPELPAGELAWTKVSKGKLSAYKRVVDVFFAEEWDFEVFEFHTLVVDTSQIDDRFFNAGSRETGFNKEIYQLAMKAARLHPKALFHMYPDKRNCSQPTEELRLILNRGLQKKRDPREWAYRRLHFRESCDVEALQLVDVLLGAIAFKLNGHYDKAGASPAKKELCDYILARAGIQHVDRDTAAGGSFTIWHRRLR